MKKVRQEILVAYIELNEGQIEWLPANPRTWTQTDIDNTAASIREDEDFLEERPILVVPFGKQRFVAFAGNLRLEGCRAIKKGMAPSVIHFPETAEDYDTILRRAMKDNGSYGKTDWHAVFSSKWGTLPLDKWGLQPASWKDDAPTDLGLSTEGREGEEGYEEFVDKFKQKVTTDDCYTPPAVYEAVLNFVAGLTQLDGRKIERPFVPGGDYENYAYTKASIVVDNPPFSILSKILRFYTAKGIPFFLFAPSLTLFTATDCDLTYIVSDADIEYENGARVRTGFITNLIPDIRIWVCPELGASIEDAQEKEDKTKKGFVYPDNIVTAAILQKLAAHGVELRVRKVSCEYINSSDSAKEQGRDLYGGGFMLSDGAAAERAAAERAAAERAAAERAAATRLNISSREREIIERLNQQDGTNDKLE